SRRLMIAPCDLRPLIPRRRAPIRQKEAQQLQRRLAPSQTYESPDDADLIGRVARGHHGAAALAAPINEIRLEGAIEGSAVQPLRHIEQIYRICGRRRIEVRPLDAAWNVLQLALRPGRFDRGEQRGGEARAQRVPT